MRCDLAARGVALPTFPVPVLLTPDPLRLARFYVHALEFELLQHIVGVFASLRCGGLPLQIWGRQDARPGCTRVILEDGDASISTIHQQLMRTAPALVDTPWLRPTAWGARQFRLTDIDGNQVVFVQWPVGARLPRRGGSLPGCEGSNVSRG